MLGKMRAAGKKRRWALVTGIGLLCSTQASAWAAKPTPQVALEIAAPVQKDVVYDKPTKEQADKCKLETLSGDQGSGWLVRDASGQILRKFVDTNKDTKLDQWSYYRDGIEVYRDIDSNFNGKADQYRWLGTAGIRWGLDDDEDGKIDSWKQISPEEVTAEVVAALRDKDSTRFTRLLLTKSELSELGLGDSQQQSLAKKLEAAEKAFAELARKQKIVGEKTTWTNFGATQPGLLPAGSDELSKDLVVYENVSAVVETDGKNSQVAVGTLVQVDRLWRLIDVPSNLLDEKAASGPGGYFFSVSAANPARTVPGEASAEMQKLAEDLEKVEQALAKATDPEQLSQLNAKRADVLEGLFKSATSDEERSTWIRQLADTIGSAVQSGGYRDGIARLESLEEQLKSSNAKSDYVAYVHYRVVLARYTVDSQDPQVEPEKLQTKWIESLEGFINDFAGTSDIPDAMLQLGMAHEFSNKTEEALRWYSRIMDEHGESEVARKATGAKRRLESVGKSIPLQARTLDGKTVDLASLRGNVVVIHYWATWCEPCKQDMAKLRELQAKYAKQKFRLIGVNLDNDAKTAVDFLKANRLPWEQAFEPGGLEGRLAAELGVFTLPTMLLVDADGRVANRNIHVGELESELSKRFREREKDANAVAAPRNTSPVAPKGPTSPTKGNPPAKSASPSKGSNRK